MWWVGWMICRICSFRYVAVAHISRLYNCECAKCGNMSCDPEENEE